MNRVTREHALMATAFIWARRSTCDRLQVGCVLHREGRILVQGYNGAPAGLPHCDHTCTCSDQLDGYSPGGVIQEHLPDCWAGPNYCRAVHAEQNAIAWAARVGVSVNGATLVCTHQPCLSCARSIVNAGIVEVLYSEPYRLKDGLDLLHEAGIRVEKYLDSTISDVVG